MLNDNDGYIISFEDGAAASILHLGCGMRSFNPNDIDNAYCGHCHRYLDLFVFDDGQALPRLLKDAMHWPETLHPTDCRCARCNAGRVRMRRRE